MKGSREKGGGGGGGSVWCWVGWWPWEGYRESKSRVGGRLLVLFCPTFPRNVGECDGIQLFREHERLWFLFCVCMTEC